MCSKVAKCSVILSGEKNSLSEILSKSKYPVQACVTLDAEGHFVRNSLRGRRSFLDARGPSTAVLLRLRSKILAQDDRVFYSGDFMARVNL